MSGLLDLLLGGAGVANQVMGAQAKGDQMRRDREQQQSEHADMLRSQQDQRSLQSLLTHSTIDKNAAETNKLLHPTPKRTYDATRGAMVNEDDGTATPIAGLPQSLKEAPLPIWKQQGFDSAKAFLDFKRQEGDATRGPDRTIVAVDSTAPDGTKTTRYVTREQALKDGNAPVGKQGGPGSAQSAMALQRLGMSLGDVESAIGKMDTMENDPKFRAKLTASQQAMGSASQVVPDDHAHGIMGVINNAGGSLVSSAARSNMDKDLQEYMRLKQIVGLAFTEALPRPNQALLGMEKGLSGIDAGGFSDPIIKEVQNRRRMGAAALKSAIGVLQGTSAPAGGGGRVSPLRAKYDAAVAHLKATGREADIARLPVPQEDE